MRSRKSDSRLLIRYVTHSSGYHPDMQGLPVPPPKAKGAHFDSNCITPGTPFMDRLAVCLRYYIHNRLNSDPAWKNIQVLYCVWVRRYMLFR